MAAKIEPTTPGIAAGRESDSPAPLVYVPVPFGDHFRTADLVQQGARRFLVQFFSQDGDSRPFHFQVTLMPFGNILGMAIQAGQGKDEDDQQDP